MSAWFIIFCWCLYKMTKVGKTQETKRPGCNITVFATGCQLETPRKVRTTTPRSHCTEAMGGEGLEMLKKHHVFQPRRYFVTIRGDDISRGSIVNCQQLTITDGEGLERMRSIQKPQVRKPEKFECTFVSYSVLRSHFDVSKNGHKALRRFAS